MILLTHLSSWTWQSEHLLRSWNLRSQVSCEVCILYCFSKLALFLQFFLSYSKFYLKQRDLHAICHLTSLSLTIIAALKNCHLAGYNSLFYIAVVMWMYVVKRLNPECLAALYPIDTIKTRLQATISGGGLNQLLKGGGGKALYAGIWGNLAGVVPASAIFMGIYEPVKQHVLERVSEDRSYLGALTGGAAAGLAASIVRVPTEVVKQRLQTGNIIWLDSFKLNATILQGTQALWVYCESARWSCQALTSNT